jgi:hypothetical protein
MECGGIDTALHRPPGIQGGVTAAAVHTRNLMTHSHVKAAGMLSNSGLEPRQVDAMAECHPETSMVNVDRASALAVQFARGSCVEEFDLVAREDARCIDLCADMGRGLVLSVRRLVE